MYTRDGNTVTRQSSYNKSTRGVGGFKNMFVLKSNTQGKLLVTGRIRQILSMNRKMIINTRKFQ